MSSTLLLRTLLIASALSGALVFACGEDTTQNTNNSNADDDDDGDDDDDDKPTKDAGRDSGRADARADSGRRDGAAAGCTGPGQLCTDEDGNRGFQMCDQATGQLSPCMGVALGDAATVEMCPDGFMCTSLFGQLSLCTMGGLASLPELACQSADDCAGLGLEGAACTQLPMVGGICRLPCTAAGGTPTSDAGAGGDEDEDAGNGEDTGDAGSTSTGGDAGRDSGSSSGSSDAGRGRDR